MVLSLVLETIDFVSRTTFVSRKGEEREPAKGRGNAHLFLSFNFLQMASRISFSMEINLKRTFLWFIKIKLKI